MATMPAATAPSTSSTRPGPAAREEGRPEDGQAVRPGQRPGRAAWRAARGTVADEDAAWAAWQAHDAAADGRLWIGVTSTGIYCRPVCRVRLPRRENCRFFAQAGEAEAAGFRPCLRCRPEQAPGLSRVDGPATLADLAADWLRPSLQTARPPALGPIAARLGISPRHLRRIFVRRHGLAPLAWWQAWHRTLTGAGTGSTEAEAAPTSAPATATAAAQTRPPRR